MMAGPEAAGNNIPGQSTRRSGELPTENFPINDSQERPPGLRSTVQRREPNRIDSNQRSEFRSGA